MSNGRAEKILEILDQKGSVTLKELCEVFPTYSSMTIRRDLEALEKQDKLIRVKGGARSLKHISQSFEQVYSERESENRAGKERIARKAVSFVSARRCIYLDSGSTVMSLARLIPDVNLYVITSGLNVATEIAAKQHPTLNIVGGVLNRVNLSISDEQAVALIRSVNIDLAFVTPSGFSLESGFTCGNNDECELKKSVVKKARCVIVLMDHTKFDKSMPYTFAKIEHVNTIICDEAPPSDMLAACQAQGIEILW